MRGDPISAALCLACLAMCQLETLCVSVLVNALKMSYMLDKHWKCQHSFYFLE